MHSCTQGDHSPDNVTFPDNSLTVHDTHVHVCTTVIVTGVGRSATVHDPKPK